MSTLIVTLNIISVLLSTFSLFYINKYTNKFGPIKTLNLIFLSFLCVEAIHLTPLKELLHTHHTTLLPFFQFLILVTYIIEVRVIKFQGNWMPSDILNNLPDMLWVKDKEGRFLYANDAICKKLLLLDKKNVIGKTSVEIAEKNIEKGINYTFGEICGDSDRVVIAKNTAKIFLEVGKIDEVFLAIQVIKAPIYDEDGEVKGTVGCGRDLTYDLKEHAKLQKLYEEKNYEDFEKLFEEHKYRHLLVEKDSCPNCVSLEKHLRV